MCTGICSQDLMLVSSLCVSYRSLSWAHTLETQERGDGRKEVSRFRGWENPKESKVMVEELFAKGGEDKDTLSLESSIGSEEGTASSKLTRRNLSWAGRTRRVTESTVNVCTCRGDPQDGSRWLILLGSTSSRRRKRFILLGAPVPGGGGGDLRLCPRPPAWNVEAPTRGCPPSKCARRWVNGACRKLEIFILIRGQDNGTHFWSRDGNNILLHVQFWGFTHIIS